MATSGSTDFNLTRNEIIKRSLRLLGQLSEGESPSAQQLSDANISLNSMVKFWQKDGVHLWKYREAILFLAAGQQSYDLPTSHCTESFVETSAKAAIAESALPVLTIDVDDSSLFADGDNIGILQDDGTIHWTTVDGVPVGDTVTIADTFTAGVSVDNAVYGYTTAIGRPELIENVRREAVVGGSETPVNIISRQKYMLQTDKASAGATDEVYLDKQLTKCVLYVWGVQSADNINRLRFSYIPGIEDFDSSGNTADFPVEWLDPLVFNLAARLAFEYGMPSQERMDLKQEADRLYFDAVGWDRERASVFITPDMGE